MKSWDILISLINETLTLLKMEGINFTPTHLGSLLFSHQTESQGWRGKVVVVLVGGLSVGSHAEKKYSPVLKASYMCKTTY